MRALLVVLIAFGAGSILVLAAPKPEVRDPDVEVVYRRTEQAELKMEIFRPADWKESDRRPGIVFFFGGGWAGGSTTQFYPQATHLAKRGIVAMCADYRVRRRHQTTPFDAVEDAKAAVRWLWRNAEEQGVDRTRIVASGGSAGGHLAACCGVIRGFDEVKEGEPVLVPAAMVLFNPVIDTSKAGFGHKVLKERYKEVSPVLHVHAKAPPTLIVVGSADTTTPPLGDETFAAKMKKLGRSCRLEIYAGQKHGFFNARGDNEHYWKTLKAVDEFLESLGYLEAAPASAPGS